ncbi:hypothetical protein QFZ77_002917 [Paenibacillus sp. V4I3]|uniref:hypothetical protein n=1 Tax=Paenibacillus sp. V4I3 TaxID=3042305 RepID=UPI002783838C|nr:hypothetical protein [Paenibacillus sp. V4I3]MDQ0874258.1 hypothetical protein [Paenibacillus sp. V4I3]
MTEEYCLFKPTSDFIMNITKEKYLRIIEVKQYLVSMLKVEEKLNLLIENYLELEKDILNVSFNKMISPIYSTDWTLAVSDIHLINRRIINFLTTSKLYLDQISHDIKELSSDPSIPLLVEKLRNTEYDNVLGYRVIEALRNYVQHRGLPVHILSLNMSKVGDLSKHVITPFLKIDELKKDGKFKATVLKELDQLNDKVDLKQNIRQYINSITKIHSSIRELLSENVQLWDAEFMLIYEEFNKEYGDTESLGIGEIYLGIRRNITYIMKEPIKRRKWLEQKNRELINLESRFVSSELT